MSKYKTNMNVVNVVVTFIVLFALVGLCGVISSILLGGLTICCLIAIIASCCNRVSAVHSTQREAQTYNDNQQYKGWTALVIFTIVGVLLFGWNALVLAGVLAICLILCNQAFVYRLEGPKQNHHKKKQRIRQRKLYVVLQDKRNKPQ